MIINALRKQTHYPQQEIVMLNWQSSQIYFKTSKSQSIVFEAHEVCFMLFEKGLQYILVILKSEVYFCLLSKLQSKVIHSKLKIHSEVGESSMVTLREMLQLFCLAIAGRGRKGKLSCTKGDAPLFYVRTQKLSSKVNTQA